MPRPLHPIKTQSRTVYDTIPQDREAANNNRIQDKKRAYLELGCSANPSLTFLGFVKS